MNMTSIQNFDINALTPIFNHILKNVRYEDRADVKSESIVRILNAIHTGKINKNLFTFAHTVVQRTVFDYYRKNNRMIVKHSTLVNFCDGAHEENNTSVDSFSYKTEEVGYDLSDVKNDYFNNKVRFTPQERKIIEYMLFTEEGMDMKPTEISNLLDLNKSHASRAMNKLKKICQEYA